MRHKVPITYVFVQLIGEARSNVARLINAEPSEVRRLLSHEVEISQKSSGFGVDLFYLRGLGVCQLGHKRRVW